MEPSILMNLTRGRIVRMLVLRGSATAAAIATELELNRITVNRALGRLSDAGIIRMTIHAPDISHPSYSVELPQIHQEMAQVRQFFAPWL